MTLNQLKSSIAAYLDREVTDLTSKDGTDLGLLALNQVRTSAELLHDFEFSRKLVTVTVDGVTGGSLDNAKIYGTNTIVMVKSIVDVGVFDSDGNLIPADWTTVTESLRGQRGDNPSTIVPRVPTDAQAISGPLGIRRFVFSGNNVFFFPKTPDATFTLGLEVYTFEADWVDDDLISTSIAGGYWTSKGHQFLLWGSIVHLNHLFKAFVFRQEGNLPPPQTLRDEGLETFKQWDIFRYEQFGRHG